MSRSALPSASCEWEWRTNGAGMEAEVFRKRSRALCSLLMKGPPPEIPAGQRERDQEIVRLYVHEHWPIQRIAQRVGLSGERTRQILLTAGVDTSRVPVRAMTAEIFGLSPNTISAYRNGYWDIPGWVWRTLNALSACAELGGIDALKWALMNRELDEGGQPGYEIPEHKDLRLRA